MVQRQGRVVAGFGRAPMSIRVSPYLLSLIDWTDPYNDPLRRQSVPVSSRLLPDHPKLTLDSLHEQADAPVPGLTHRYPDKALFLSLDTCPVYCRFCTRSRMVGAGGGARSSSQLAAAYAYLRAHPEVCDVIVSGGDPLVMSDANSPLPTLDSTRLLARAALQRAVQAG